MSCARALLSLIEVKTRIPSVREIAVEEVEMRIERVLEQGESSTALRA
jgi:hypothetical protein